MTKSVLVAMDDSPLGRKALEYAFDIFPEARIVATHVAYLEFDMLPSDTEEVYEASLADVADVGDETAQLIFESVAEIADGRPVAVTFLTGEPGERLVEYTLEAEFDHIVLGTHGRDGLSRLLIGSVAEDVVRRTEVPTTLVK